jgi:hypothetical protein
MEKEFDFNTLVAEPRETEEKPVRRVTWIHVVVMVIGALMFWWPILSTIGEGLSKGIKDPWALIPGLTRLTITFCVIASVGAVVDRALRRRSRWPGTVLFLSLAFFGCVVFTAILGKAATTAKVNQFQDFALQKIVEVRKLNETETSDTKYRASLEAVRHEIIERASELPDKEGRFWTIAFDTVTGITSAVRPYMKASREYAAAGGLGVRGVKSKSDLDARRALLLNAAQEHLKFMKFLGGVRQQLQSDLEREGLDDAQWRLKADQLTKSVVGRALLPVHDVEAEMLVLQDEYLTILRDAWGDWQVNDGTLVFSGTKAQEWQEKLNKVFDELKRAVEEQKSLDVGAG